MVTLIEYVENIHILKGYTYIYFIPQTQIQLRDVNIMVTLIEYVENIYTFERGIHTFTLFPETRIQLCDVNIIVT